LGFGERKTGNDKSKGESRSLRDDNKKSKCNSNDNGNGNGNGNGKCKCNGNGNGKCNSNSKYNRRSFDCVAHKVREQLRSG
jgi:hypothetical protein